MKLLSIILVLLGTVGCSHFAVVEEAQQNGNVWVKRGTWLWSDLFYCHAPKSEQNPQCVEAEHVKY